MLEIVNKNIYERTQISSRLERKLNNLTWLNNCLIQFGENPQPTIAKARKYLKSNVFINIYDLDAELYEKRTTNQILQKQLRTKCVRRYPLLVAKSNIGLQSFLIQM